MARFINQIIKGVINPIRKVVVCFLMTMFEVVATLIVEKVYFRS